MKKIMFLWLILCCFMISGCNNQNLGENESIYEGNLVVAGIGPEISFEPVVEEGTLVLKGYFEYHSDHIFLNEGIWKDYLKNYSDYLPGNKVSFKGVVEALDSAAGNHYYNVKSVDKLKVIDYPNVGEINDLLESYSYCESDLDCEYFAGNCPFGCYIPVNKAFGNVARNIMSNYLKHQDVQCVYDCLYMDNVVCENYKCEMKSSGDGMDDKEVIYCTPKQKNADICTMEYSPVCGSDSRTYGNSCVACQSETVETYTMGECDSSAFSVEGDSEYLQEVEDILAKNGAVTCDLFYTDYDRQVHSFFMADKDRFYSAVDDYSDNLQRNVIYNLAVDGKIYSWSTFPGSEKTIINSPVDIESEISSLLMDLGEYPDFEMNCYEGIDITDEHLFSAPS